MSADHRVSEIASSRPRLRRDLRTHYQEYRGIHTYVIEDTGKGRFSRWACRNTSSQVLRRCAPPSPSHRPETPRPGGDALTEAQGDQLLRWLIDNELLEASSSGQGHRRHEHLAEREAKRPLRLLSKVFFFKIPLGSPDRLSPRPEKRFGWIFGWPGFLLWAALISTPRPASPRTGTVLWRVPDKSSPPGDGFS